MYSVGGEGATFCSFAVFEEFRKTKEQAGRSIGKEERQNLSLETKSIFTNSRRIWPNEKEAQTSVQKNPKSTHKTKTDCQCFISNAVLETGEQTFSASYLYCVQIFQYPRFQLLKVNSGQCYWEKNKLLLILTCTKCVEDHLLRHLPSTGSGGTRTSSEPPIPLLGNFSSKPSLRMQNLTGRQHTVEYLQAIFLPLMFRDTRKREHQSSSWGVTSFN